MKIAIIGYGKMGHEVEKAALARQHEIVVTIDNAQEWEERLELLKKADVAIEFSQPDQVVNNINRCFDLRLPIVVGTTAWQDHFEEIKQRCLAEQQSLFTAPNFSIGMNIMFMLNKQLAKFAERYGYQLSLSETHHIHKLDKPSGTAITLQQQIVERGDRNVEEVPITSYREGEVPGTHTVTYESPEDTIYLTHEAHSRLGLSQGAVIAAEWLAKATPGIYTMNDLLV